MNTKSTSWQRAIKELCARFDIPLQHLAATLADPKVVPMIRGKAFEFSALDALRQVLPDSDWKVEKPILNAQSEIKDIDLKVTHINTHTIIRVECKLAANKGFGTRNGISTLKVKCMRSRTLGESKVKTMAPRLGVSEEQLAADADSYRVADFDVVLTTFGNAFYRTNKAGEYEWNPDLKELEFLSQIHPEHPDHKIGAFEQLYVAKSSDLCVGNLNFPIDCPRKKCQQKTDCGFIPNYPAIVFKAESTVPINAWVPLNQSRLLFESFITQPRPLEVKTVLAEQLEEEAESNS